MTKKKKSGYGMSQLIKDSKTLYKISDPELKDEMSKAISEAMIPWVLKCKRLNTIPQMVDDIANY